MKSPKEVNNELLKARYGFTLIFFLSLTYLMYENETLTLKTSLGPYDTGVDVTLEGKAPTKVYCNCFGVSSDDLATVPENSSGYETSFSNLVRYNSVLYCSGYVIL